jgi:hypothetical protein
MYHIKSKDLPKRKGKEEEKEDVNRRTRYHHGRNQQHLSPTMKCISRHKKGRKKTTRYNSSCHTPSYTAQNTSNPIPCDEKEKKNQKSQP